MAHIWVRAEQRAFEQRVGLTPLGAAKLIAAGHKVTVEQSEARAIGIEGYQKAGCAIADAHAWLDAPRDAIIFGLKELDLDGPDLRHRHIMFGHAYKGQADGPALLQRFKAGGGTLLDLEYLTDETGRRVAAFGYWAGFAGAAVGVMAWLAQQSGTEIGSVKVYESKDAVIHELQRTLLDIAPNHKLDRFGIVIGAKGRVGRGAADLLGALGLPMTLWDIDETRNGGPFPEIMDHVLFVNCILAGPDVPVFVPPSAVKDPRALRVIADVSCDPNSTFNPIPIYDHVTTFEAPLVGAGSKEQPLDVMAIDNLPSMLPVESSEDYAGQLLPFLMELDDTASGVWGRAADEFAIQVAKI